MRWQLIDAWRECAIACLARLVGCAVAGTDDEALAQVRRAVLSVAQGSVLHVR